MTPRANCSLVEHWIYLSLDGELSGDFADGRISGTSGCNRYFAGIDNAQPYNFSVGTPGATRMLCPQPAMDIEMRYLSLLEKSTQFGFNFGDLVLHCQDESKFERMRFTHRLQ